MKCDRKHIGTLVGVLLTVLLTMACSKEIVDEPPVPPTEVTVQLNFSLPSRIVGKHQARTRMTSDIVQAGGSEEEFRGIDDVHLFCYDQVPTESSNKIGKVIQMKTTGDEVMDSVTKEDYSLCQDIDIPVGTSHFGFYARSADAPKTHEERMKYGIIETVGLDRDTYHGNSGIRFRPVPVCSATEPFGGSAKGQALLNLLNDLAGTAVQDTVPNDSLKTTTNFYLSAAYQRLTEMKTLSSENVQTLLGCLNKMVNLSTADTTETKGRNLVAVINAKIAGYCKEVPDVTSDRIALKDEYMGFPDDIHLPAGAARVGWNAKANRFEVPDSQAYGKALVFKSLNDYAYPMNLQYQVLSDIVVSDTLVLGSEVGEETAVADTTQYKNWQDLIQNGYDDTKKVVVPTTQSVAMVQQVEYAVGRLALHARFSTDNILDAYNNYVPVSDGTFTLKGYIVAGQREVNYDFQPVEGSREYAIYDTDHNGGPQRLRRYSFTEPDYILGLGTRPNQNILLAMELVNNGQAFWGADGMIPTGGTFYLVADMDPRQGQGYSAGSLDQVFCKDHATKVYLTITGLQNATYGLPDLSMPVKPTPGPGPDPGPGPGPGPSPSTPTLGVSVSLNWGEGLWFEDVPL